MVYAKPQHVWLLYDFHDFDKFHNVLYESVIKAYARMFVAFQKKICHTSGYTTQWEYHVDDYAHGATLSIML